MKLNRLSTPELLKLKIKDLNLKIEGSILEKRIDTLNSELEQKDFIFKPHIWISDEWFTPDDIAGFAVPFYLANKRLTKLEKEQMLEAEGAGKQECLRIMRHETGHAISHAYQLYYKREWKKIFGDFRKPYPLWYVPDISSKNYVAHLNAWYAQAHPLEDFAETFATWLDPSSGWRKIYKSWGALAKLNYVDKLMNDIKEVKPKIAGKAEFAPASKIKITLNEHYTRKKKFYTAYWSESFDSELKKIFKQQARREYVSASEFIKSKKRSMRKNISAVLDIPPYTVDQIIRQLIQRTDELKLALNNTADTESRLLIIITSQLLNLIQNGYYRIPL